MRERSFVYGFRTSHSVRGIVMFGFVFAFDVWLAIATDSTVFRIIDAVIGAFFLFMAYQMVRQLVQRKTGARRIVVGPKALTTPSSLTGREVEIAYADMTSVEATGGEKGKLRITHGKTTLDIDRMMLATDHEFDELIGALRKRVNR